jgi:C-terminal processing protease CtpA/Prc
MRDATCPVSAAPVRRGVHAPLLASLAMLLGAGMVPLAAQQQQRIEATRVRGARLSATDSSDRQLRRLQHEIDSLARVYNEHDDLTLVERRRVEEDLDQALGRVAELTSRMNTAMARSLRAGEHLRILMTPQAAERTAADMSRAMMQVREAEQAVPRGWIGLEVQGPGLLPRIEGGELLVRYFAYPRVISVDPSSPAQRAGLVPNDTLLAYNGMDVSENDISFTRLLRPNTKVSIRFLRDGKVRVVPVTVAPAPMRIVQRRDDESRSREVSLGKLPDGPSFPRAPFAPAARVRATMRASASSMASAPPLGPTPPAAVSLPGFPYGDAVAGAQLSTVSEGLGKALGVASGVLVTSAPVGSPASQSGLRDGDVIIRMAGRVIRRVPEVRDLVARAADNGDHAIDVEVMRQRRTVKLMLKW